MRTDNDGLKTALARNTSTCLASWAADYSFWSPPPLTASSISRVCWRLWASSHPWTGHFSWSKDWNCSMNSSCTPLCAVAQGCNQIVCTLKEDWSFNVCEWLYQIGTSGWGQTVSQGDAISSGTYLIPWGVVAPLLQIVSVVVINASLIGLSSK